MGVLFLFSVFVCLDSKYDMKFFSCTQTIYNITWRFFRCPQYPSIPAECVMVTDQSDSCCQVPECHFTPQVTQIMGTGAPVIPTKIPGVIVGQANTPAPTPGSDGNTQAPKPLSQYTDCFWYFYHFSVLIKTFK